MGAERSWDVMDEIWLHRDETLKIQQSSKKEMSSAVSKFHCKLNLRKLFCVRKYFSSDCLCVDVSELM